MYAEMGQFAKKNCSKVRKKRRWRIMTEQQRFSLPRLYNRKILKALREFELLDPGDRILVGFSGGKDSALLLYALVVLGRYGVVEGEVAAITIDPGMEPLDPEPLAEYCRLLGVKHYLVKAEIGRAIAGCDDPCARCSYLRRGLICRFAREHGYNKVALGHHHDDAVETFLMSILYSGQIRTFMPKSYLDRTGVTVIRPLVYLREREIKKAAEFLPFTPAKPVCTIAGTSYRQKVKDLLRELTRDRRWVYTNLASAMREGNPIQLWPAKRSPGVFAGPSGTGGRDGCLGPE